MIHGMPNLPASLLLLLATVASAHERDGQAIPFHRNATPELSGSAMLAWDSRYAVEGRDVLDGDSILAHAVELQWQSLGFGLWYGDSPDQRYNELQLAVSCLHSFGPVDAYLGYTHLRFLDDSAHDHDLGAGLAWEEAPWDVKFALDAYYSTRNEGWFGELSASRGWALTESLTLDASVVLGMNQGYVADGHDGLNHLALWLGLNQRLSESLSLLLHGSCSWALDRKATAPDDALLRDFFHAGIGLEWSF